MIIYYSLIFAAIAFLIIEFLKPKENGKVFETFSSQINKDADHMDNVYKISTYLQMIFCLMSTGIFVIYRDSSVECSDDQGSYAGVIWTILVV